jgi:predicted RND superfamily exporter protein
MITVAIAAMSLGVGIDYVIHLIERYREEREKGTTPHLSLAAVGSASGLALFGSAVSDIAGFLVINQSKMGFFSTFGLFCAIMIGLSLIASMVLTPAVLGLLHRKSLVSEYS